VTALVDTLSFSSPSILCAILALINVILTNDNVHFAQGTHPHANCLEPNKLGKFTDISSLAAKFDVVRVVDGT
jgi:hypothetical protein